MTEAPVSACQGGHCITCSDVAVEVRVLKLLDHGLALVDVGEGRQEEVSVALVPASIGDVVLVHASEAIGVVREEAT
ncbi:MAG TPA: HypC/HybG/HupF family hydrogenase formation chaperone [Actinomycetales bacterium]|jgi:hydrogenase expression/formation protein HypC|nr:HypC/HybG/HupF family hydrogenase formation chaperone [Actinomycetales bacterium]